VLTRQSSKQEGADKMKTLRNRWNAFTLIELLVVIVIIAILAALLFPAINKVKELANRAACQANMHQFDVALMAYCYPPVTVYPSNLVMLGSDVGPNMFVCPGDKIRSAAGTVSNITAATAASYCSFYYQTGLSPSSESGLNVIWDKTSSNHVLKGWCALQTDHSTRWYANISNLVDLASLMTGGTPSPF